MVIEENVKSGLGVAVMVGISVCVGDGEGVGVLSIRVGERA